MNQIVKELVVVHRIQYFVLGGFYPSFTNLVGKHYPKSHYLR